MLKRSILLLALCLAINTLSQAGILKFEKRIAWASFQDLTNSAFDTKFIEYEKAGYLMIDIDAYDTPKGIRYAMVWRKNTDRRRWVVERDLTSTQYNSKSNSYRNRGYRLHDVESYQLNGQQRYAGVWVENKEGYVWASERDLTDSEYLAYFNIQKDNGFRIIDLEVYNTGNSLRYASVWVKNTDGIQWEALHNMDLATFQRAVSDQAQLGFMVVDYESYTLGGTKYYAAIWEQRSGFAYQLRIDMSEVEFANKWREYLDKGYRLVDFERNGSDYSGLWLEVAPRYAYGRKGQLDNLISAYQSNNNLPGISVAVIEDGEMIYRRGFGYADVGAQKVAHGGSIYLTASISKIIGGTIAVKFEDEGRMQNGQTVNLDMRRPTRDYLIDVPKSDGTKVTLPSQHQHTVEQLYAHLGCIQHYSGPEPATQQYDKAIDALTQIWNANFISGCSLGNDRNYSTHAHTYTAAVLEQVTGRNSAQLVRSEIAEPYGLPTIRSLYTTSSIPFNYERVKPYRNNNTPTSFSNNSWKVFGGGIEASPVDMAWFGWKVLEGKIIRPAARDNRLWRQVNNNHSNGIAWDTRSIGGRRVAEHSGSWTGTLTRLRVYRDDNLVIVVMSNRGNHTVSGTGGLSTDIADIVLN